MKILATTVRRQIVGAQITLLMLYPVVTAFLNPPRAEIYDDDKIVAMVSASSGLSGSGLLAHLAIYGLAMLGLLAYLFLRRRDPISTYVFWLLAASIFYLPLLIDILNSKELILSLFLTPFLFFSALLLDVDDIDWLLSWTRKIVLIYLYATVVYIIFYFDAAKMDDCGLCPLGPLRIDGFANHAHALAVVPIAFFALDIAARREKWALLNYAHWVVGLVLLISTQSKTPIIGALIALSILVTMITKGTMRGLTISALGLLGTFFAILWFLILPETGAAGFQESASTLTSRTGIWEFSFDQWKENMSGYGSDFFGGGTAMSERFYIKTGMSTYSAHSQFLTTLGQSGIPGLASLLLYLTMYAVILLRSHGTTRYAAGLLYVVMLFWCVTEISFVITVFQNRFFLHYLLFILTVLLIKQSNSQTEYLEPAARST